LDIVLGSEDSSLYLELGLRAVLATFKVFLNLEGLNF
jgi:hypothetical protein